MMKYRVIRIVKNKDFIRFSILFAILIYLLIFVIQRLFPVVSPDFVVECFGLFIYLFNVYLYYRIKIKKDMNPPSFVICLLSLIFLSFTALILLTPLRIEPDFEYYGIIIGGESVLLGFTIVIIQLNKTTKDKLPLLFNPMWIYQLLLFYYIFLIFLTVLIMMQIMVENAISIKLNIILFNAGLLFVFRYGTQYIRRNPYDILKDYFTAINDVIKHPKWTMRLNPDFKKIETTSIVERISDYTIKLSYEKRFTSFRYTVERMFEESKKHHISIIETNETDNTEIDIYKKFIEDFSRIFEGIIENRRDSEIFLKCHKKYLLAIWHFNSKNVRKMDTEKISRFSEEIQVIWKLGEIGLEENDKGEIIDLIIDEIDVLLNDIGKSIREWKKYKVVERDIAVHLHITLIKYLNYFGIESAKKGLKDTTHSYLNIARQIGKHYRISEELKMDTLTNCWLAIFNFLKIKSIEDVKGAYKEFGDECGNKWIKARDKVESSMEGEEIEAFRLFVQKLEEV